jgi:hypothetical protein
MMEEVSEESKELELLERVFLRLGVAERDSQLEEALARFLPPVLLKTASTSPAVQAKVSWFGCCVVVHCDVFCERLWETRITEYTLTNFTH